MVSLLACALLASLCPWLTPAEDEPEPVRYVRVSLPGNGRHLSLAEVEVFSGGTSIAIGAKAEQSSTYQGATADRAVDGDVNGDLKLGSVTHTEDRTESWWEVDLGQEVPIDRIVVWNRTDCCGDRLSDFTTQLYDGRHKLVWERFRTPIPTPSVELIPFTEPAPITGPSPEERHSFQPNIDAAIDRGVEYLIRQQLWDGSYAQHQESYLVGSTGLALYTLLKCHVPKDHPAVQRALAYVLASEPAETYELGTVLMALGALGKPLQPEVEACMQSALERLLGFQGAPASDGRKDALWAYPAHANIVDLSNSQYAALGLLAAERAGLDVPDRVWKRMADSVLRYQEEPRKVKDLLSESGSTTGEMSIAGFYYRAGEGAASASMTTAGLGILGLSQAGLGGASSTNRKLRPAIRHAIGWLAHHFTVRSNPGGGQSWLLYYLYGLERAGALHGLERFGPYDWYWEGARPIVSWQDGDGSWSSGNTADTCFALLFLARATASASTGGEEQGLVGSWASESPDLDVSWRILGGAEATFFVSGFSDLVQEELATGLESGPASSLGLHVLKVEYLVDGEVVATVPASPEKRWSAERFPAQHDFEQAGTHVCQVRVRVASPEVGADGTATELLLGEPLEVQVTAVRDPRLLEYGAEARANLLRDAQPTATASSEARDGVGPGRAVDGLLGTAWISATDDPGPILNIELKTPTKGRVLMLAMGNQSEAERGRYDRPTKLRIQLRGRKAETHVVDVSARDEEKLVLVLEKPLALRGIDIEVLERKAGERDTGSVAISEVQWLLEP